MRRATQKPAASLNPAACPAARAGSHVGVQGTEAGVAGGRQGVDPGMSGLGPGPGQPPGSDALLRTVAACLRGDKGALLGCSLPQLQRCVLLRECGRGIKFI